MNAEDKINDYINSHPRESLMCVMFALMLIWQTIPALIALVLYVVLIRLIQVNRWVVLVAAVLIAMEAIYLSQSHVSVNAFKAYLKFGFKENKLIWRFLFANQPLAALSYAIHYHYLYLLGSPLFM